MNHRTKMLWIPGLVTLTIASVTLMVVERMALHHPGWPVRDSALAYYLPWLVSLPFCGALGAYLSRRAGGTRTAGFASAVFPAIVMFAVFCMILPIGVFVEKNKFIIHHPLYFAVALVIWVVIPCTALLLGALLVPHYAASQAPTRIPA